MKVKVVVHEAEEGGFWAEVPSISGCATQGDSFEELLTNLYETIEGCLSVTSSTLDPPKCGFAALSAESYTFPIGCENYLVAMPPFQSHMGSGGIAASLSFANCGKV